MHFERKIVTKTTLSPKYLRGRGVTLAETKRKTFVTSMGSVAQSMDSSIGVTPLSSDTDPELSSDCK